MSGILRSFVIHTLTLNCCGTPQKSFKILSKEGGRDKHHLSFGQCGTVRLLPPERYCRGSSRKLLYFFFPLDFLGRGLGAAFLGGGAAGLAAGFGGFAFSAGLPFVSAFAGGAGAAGGAAGAPTIAFPFFPLAGGFAA